MHTTITAHKHLIPQTMKDVNVTTINCPYLHCYSLTLWCWNATLVKRYFDTKITECHLSSAKNIQSNGQTFKSWVSGGLQWPLIPAPMGSNVNVFQDNTAW